MSKNNYQKKIIPTEDLIGECNTNCDEQLADYEAMFKYRKEYLPFSWYLQGLAKHYNYNFSKRINLN